MKLEDITAEQSISLALQIQAESEKEAAKLVMKIQMEAYEAGLQKGAEIAERTLIEPLKKMFS